jgi:hypothetical protein
LTALFSQFNKSELDADDDADTPEQEKQELATILRKGVALHGGDQDTAVTDDQINEMLARSMPTDPFIQ